MRPFNCVKKKMSSGLFKNVTYKMCLEIIYLIYMYKYFIPAIVLMSWVFPNGPGDQGSIPGRVILKKIALDADLLSTVRKGKVEKFREWSSVLPYTLV